MTPVNVKREMLASLIENLGSFSYWCKFTGDDKCTKNLLFTIFLK